MIVVETTPVGENEQRRYCFRIDAERKAVVRRAIEIRFQANQPWQAYTRIGSHDYQQVAPGFWLPNEVKYESVEVTAELTPEKLSWSYKGSNRDWKVNQELQPTDADDLVQEVFSAVAKQVGDWLHSLLTTVPLCGLEIGKRPSKAGNGTGIQFQRMRALLKSVPGKNSIMQ